MAAKKPVKKAKSTRVVPKTKVVTKVKAKSVASAVAKKPASKAIGKLNKTLTKSELYSTIADSVELNRKQVAAVFDKLGEVIAQHLKKDGPEKFVLPGILKIVVKKVPARPAREGINPFNGEMMTFKAKPASKKVKVVALSSLKAMC